MVQAWEQEGHASSGRVHQEHLRGVRKPQQGGLSSQEKSSGSLQATSELHSGEPRGGEGTQSARCPWQAAHRSVRVGTRGQKTSCLVGWWGWSHAWRWRTPQNSQCSVRTPAPETAPCSKGFAVPLTPGCFHLLVSFSQRGMLLRDPPLALPP